MACLLPVFGASNLLGFLVLAQVSVSGFFIRVSELNSVSCQTLRTHRNTMAIPSGPHHDDA